MDPTELTTISITSKCRNGELVSIPVDLITSEAVCEAAGRPAKLVAGQLMEKFTDPDGCHEPMMIMHGMDAPANAVPVWVGIYRPTSTVYYMDMQTPYFCVVHHEDTNGAAEHRLDTYMKHYFDTGVNLGSPAGY
ncbi:MAG: hypothetical protein NC489_08520 [Ruminococcus flavefaciens]|nr:hypothetical protein [Ruminococcus flavefaciens]